MLKKNSYEYAYRKYADVNLYEYLYLIYINIYTVMIHSHAVVYFLINKMKHLLYFENALINEKKFIFQK